VRSIVGDEDPAMLDCCRGNQNVCLRDHFTSSPEIPANESKLVRDWTCHIENGNSVEKMIELLFP
jgi:hypothetical protein